jgi:uncharacterized protein with beta-barrel porin domain
LHDSNPDRSSAAKCRAVPGTSFVVSGAAPARDAVFAAASAELKWPEQLVARRHQSEFSVTGSYTGKGVAHYTS